MRDAPTFLPDWVSPTGATVRDILEERGMSCQDFSDLIGLSLDEISSFLTGHLPVDSGLADKLVAVLGSTVEFWIERENQYRRDLQISELRTDLTPGLEWLKILPVAEMLKFSWIEPTSSKLASVAACLTFFGVKDISDWTARYSVIYRLAYRTSPTHQSKLGPLAAWLRQGEIMADQFPCGKFNLERFKALLPDLRSLTRRKDPTDFLTELSMLCRTAGVSVAIVRAPKGCAASGAAMIRTTGEGLILLSFRYLSDDHFWFTFFHECGHLILHDCTRPFLELEDGRLDELEAQANQFSKEVLLPGDFQQELGRISLDMKSIVRFAQTVGVSAGIIVGQLQRAGRLEFKHYAGLKRRYAW